MWAIVLRTAPQLYLIKFYSSLFANGNSISAAVIVNYASSALIYLSHFSSLDMKSHGRSFTFICMIYTVFIPLYAL